jgi:predicted ribosome quality control (RQC) complex YloA/Tae2 family protein
MKSEVSSLELHYLLKELQALIGAKLEQVYQVGRDDFTFQLHVPSTGKKIVRLLLGKLVYLASAKGEMPEKPPGFCVYLRKRLKNARLREVKRVGVERIVEFVFETKDGKFRIIAELFSRGNMAACDEAGKILSVLERQEWKDRSIKQGEVYRYPKTEVSFLNVSDSNFISIIRSSGKESIVKSLALDLGLGGVYAEEICLLSGIDKSLKPAELSDREISLVCKALSDILNKDISAQIVYFDPEKTEVKDIVPFPLLFYKKFTGVPSESFSSALDSVLTQKTDEKAVVETEKVSKTRVDKINEMISQQRMRIAGLEESAAENQRRGEAVYENYILVDQVIKQISEERKKSSWQEIADKLKGHKLIKSVNVKTGEVTVEL